GARAGRGGWAWLPWSQASSTDGTTGPRPPGTTRWCWRPRRSCRCPRGPARARTPSARSPVLLLPGPWGRGGRGGSAAAAPKGETAGQQGQHEGGDGQTQRQVGPALVLLDGLGRSRGHGCARGGGCCGPAGDGGHDDVDVVG